MWLKDSIFLEALAIRPTALNVFLGAVSPTFKNPTKRLFYKNAFPAMHLEKYLSFRVQGVESALIGIPGISLRRQQFTIECAILC